MKTPKEIAAEAVQSLEAAAEVKALYAAIIEKAVGIGVAGCTERVIELCGQFTYARHLGEHLRNEL